MVILIDRYNSIKEPIVLKGAIPVSPGGGALSAELQRALKEGKVQQLFLTAGEGQAYPVGSGTEGAWVTAAVAGKLHLNT